MCIFMKAFCPEQIILMDSTWRRLAVCVASHVLAWAGIILVSAMSYPFITRNTHTIPVRYAGNALRWCRVSL